MSTPKHKKVDVIIAPVNVKLVKTAIRSHKKCCVPWCKENTCKNTVCRLSTIDVSNVNVSSKKLRKHHESLFKRREECERLGLGCNVNKLPTDLRHCDKHPIESIEGKHAS